MAAGRLRFSRRSLLESGAIVWLIVLVLFVLAAFQSSDFRSIDNLSNLTRQFSVLGLAALAQFVVVVSGGVDLSIAANIRVSAIVAAMVMDGSNDRLVLGIAAGACVGLSVGVVNSLIVTRLGVEPFIATLGTGALLSGLALFLASTPKGRSSPLLDQFYGWQLGPVYATFFLVVVVWLCAAYAIERTPWGRHLYAVGGDSSIARISGIHVTRVTSSAYVIAGVLGGVAGIVTLASAGVGDSALATGLEFDSLAVVVIGGTSLAGGRGRLLGVLGGVVLFSLLGNVFNLLHVDIWYQQLVRGLIILIAAAALVDQQRHRFGKSKKTQPATPQMEGIT